MMMMLLLVMMIMMMLLIMMIAHDDIMELGYIIFDLIVSQSVLISFYMMSCLTLGLISKPELNGLCAIVKEVPEAVDGRYKLSLLDTMDKLILVKVDNLSLLLAPAEYEDVL